MASLRKASSYSKKKARPFTRKSGKRKKSFIKTVPQNKIVKVTMGNQRDFSEGKHTHSVSLIADENCQIRDNAIEASRLLVNKNLDKVAAGQYFFAVKIAPHHILRENKTAAGAGADRLSSGMKHSYGINVGRAAIVKDGKEIFFISCTNERTAREAKKALLMVKSKLPCKTRIVFEKIEK